MRVALMNQFFPPARAPTGMLLSDLADTLRARGHEVEVICSEHHYGRATGVPAKLKEYMACSIHAYRGLQRMDPPPDAVVSMTTPPFLGLAAAALKKKKGVPFMLWCMDLYPEALAAGGLLKKDGLLYRLLAHMTAAERGLASCIVTLGPDMTRRLERHQQKNDHFFKAGGTPAVRIAGVPPADCSDSVPLNHRKAPGFDARMMEVPVWSRLNPSPDAQAAARKIRQERGWGDDEIICLYSGNMGRAHRAEEFAALADQAIPNIRFVFCGSGPVKKEWQAKYETLFEWLDPVEDDQLTAHLLSADIHLISQQPEWIGVVEPSKYQAACALGRPVLFAGPADCAVAGWIRQFDNGWVVPPGDTDAAEKAAQKLGRPISVPHNPFDAETLKNRLAERLEQIGATRLKPLPVTVVIPVRNEELNLPACLDALRDAFANVLIVDSGSTDRTGEIAERAGVQVLQFQWDGKYPKKRNWTLQNVDFQTEWVLFLDADERVTPELIEELRRTLPDTPHVGFRVSFTNWFLGRPLHHGDVFTKLPLFRVGAGAYEKFPEDGWSRLDMEVHEHPVLNGTIGKLHARIEHNDFRSLEHYLKKHDAYADWEANRFLWFQTAGKEEWGRLTSRQRFKYRLLNKPGLGGVYFLVSYLLKLGFLDGAAGFHLARRKAGYFREIRRKIKEKRRAG